MHTPNTGTLGLCGTCKEWFQMRSGSLPRHHQKDTRKQCRDSGMSPAQRKYFVRSTLEGRDLAKFIMRDNDRCLSSGLLHSMACGDGARCADERRLLAQALATYCIEKILNCSN